jgi:hypothetical protein
LGKHIAAYDLDAALRRRLGITVDVSEVDRIDTEHGDEEARLWGKARYKIGGDRVAAFEIFVWKLREEIANGGTNSQRM